MKNFYAFIIVLFIISCQKETKHIGKLKTHNPQNEISQIIINPEAERLFEKASEKNKISEHDSAKIFLEKSLILEENPIIYNEIGITLMAQKKFDEAIKYYQKSIVLDSTYYPTFINISRCYLKTEKYEKGKKILKKMISNSDSEYWKAYGNMYLALFYFNVDKD
ncbi:tetratricopeptide repeat protein [Flavobacterium sp.]|uniref:tetratricopeptide repeat protein n=1 Tax=Flavobacterium sp. TaxID=239 RepID=UPI002623CCC6|nr:tetratricopeptide repeat protein [Flavobacterium sp.]